MYRKVTATKQINTKNIKKQDQLFSSEAHNELIELANRNSISPEEVLMIKEREKIINKMKVTLNPEEIRVIDLHTREYTNKEIAESLHVEPASVTGMLEKLRNKGLIKWEPRKAIRLTEDGKRIAMQLNEIHTLLYQFFAHVLKIEDQEVIENLSCEIEHHITRDVKNSLEQFLSKYLDVQI